MADYTNYLMHYGILGQKWGVRRYQNKDGTLTPAGKKRFYNADGSLNYRGLKKQRKDAIDKDPYGKTKKEGGSGRTSEQSTRLRNDTLKYGHKGVNRIKDKMSTGQTYSKAKRSESVRYKAKLAAGTLAYIGLMDLALTGGAGAKAVAHHGKWAAKKVINNAAGIMVGSLGVAKGSFDDKMLKGVFG